MHRQSKEKSKALVWQLFANLLLQRPTKPMLSESVANIPLSEPIWLEMRSSRSLLSTALN